MYLLVQHATTRELAASDGYLTHSHAPGELGTGPETGSPGPSNSFVTQLGPSVAIALPDERAERSRERIIPRTSLAKVLLKVKELPDSVRHLIWVTAAPLAYPTMKVLEKLLKSAENGVIFKTGAGGRGCGAEVTAESVQD